ncbi:MAG: Rrf2 family transcriptional regulator [Candidatus Omnitrophica bacterium]|nr:Rrf2 family transcriptional regulator [Candidatus Omnitrophota bacterium]
MKLSTRSTYGLRALVELALASGRGPLSASVVAKRQHLSVAYLEQLLHRLKRGGIISSVRGPRGGYALARAPSTMTMAEIVRILEGTSDDANGHGTAGGVAWLSNGRRPEAKRGRSRVSHDRHAQWVAQAVVRCVHERITQSLSAITLQHLCDEARAIAGEPLDHRYVFHI